MKKTLLNQNDKAEIFDRLRRLRPDSQRQWGKMTPHQMVCHLSDGYRNMMGERGKLTNRSNFFSKKIMKWLALELPMKWPTGVKTTPEADQEIGGTPPVEFERDIAQLERAFNRFAALPRDFEFEPHPLFGQMTDDEWMRWGYLHADHHLRQFGV